MLPKISGEFRVVADPELRFAPSGMAVGSCRIVANSRKKNRDTDEWEDDKVVWLRVTAFEKMGENLAESFAKGDLIFVEGRLFTNEYEKDGEKRQSYEITADTIALPVRWNAAKKMATERATPAAPAEDPWGTPPAGQGDEPPF